MSQAFPSSAAQDDVAVFDGFSQVFRAARPVKGTVREPAKLMEHPIESGVNVVDHKVIQSVEITLECVLLPENYRDTYEEIRKLFLDSVFLTVQTRSATYESMVIEELPHEEDPAMYDTITMDIKLKEAVIVEAEYGELPPKKVSNKSMSSTQQGGEAQAQAAGGNDSWLYKARYGS